MKFYLIACAVLIPFGFLFAQDIKYTSSFYSYDQIIPGTSLNIKMVPVASGDFIFGSKPDADFKEADEEPAHNVSVNAFWMGAFEITYEQYDAFARDESTSFNSTVDAVTRPTTPYIDLTLGMGKTSGFPANSMQQFGALMFCRWLYLKTGTFFRLPSEAEWEYACRAGSETIYPFGNNCKNLGEYAWYADNSEEHYHKVGELKPNKWGLYDMLGNVAEWTLDQYDENFHKTLSDTSESPVRLPTAKYPRSVRGGSYADDAKELRCANRLKSDPIWNRRDPQIPKSRWWNADAPFIGFRIIRPLQQPTKEEADAFFKLFLII